MELIKAKQLATRLMNQHYLFNWSFNWNNRKNAYGVCSHNKRQIYLSKILTPHLQEHEVKNTVLHEIAHALVGGRHGHDYVWRSKAIEIGCDGSRTSSYDISNVRAKYVAICKGCGEKHTANRRPKRSHWCKCIGSFNPEMKLNYVQQY